MKISPALNVHKTMHLLLENIYVNLFNQYINVILKKGIVSPTLYDNECGPLNDMC